MSFKPFQHQQRFADMWGAKERLLNLSGCGTGKTGGVIHTVQKYWPEARVLVLAPLSILRSAWGGDLDSFWPETSYSIAYARNRETAIKSRSQWVITTHDAVKAIAKNDWHKDFDILVVDEADMFRNGQTQRTKALFKLAYQMGKICLMTGTPTPNTVTDIWSLAFCIDGGERLGRYFTQFRNQVCHATPIPGAPPGAMKWTDRPDAVEHVTNLLADVTFRVELSEVIELPETVIRTVEVEMPAKLRRVYDRFAAESLAIMESGEVLTAIHAGARRQKLMQMMSGAVYDDGEPVDMHTDRHDLAIQMAMETDAALVAFNWRHQRTGLEKAAKKVGLTYAVIDGSTGVAARERIVKDFQDGRIRVLLAHPQSAGHGLTLTRANRVIWASPTDRADLYEQFNHRIKRPGQSRRTEIIHIACLDSLEEVAYSNMLGKKASQDDLLYMMYQMAKKAA